MHLITSFLGDIEIVRVSGVVNAHASGRLCDALVASLADSRDKVIVDISGVDTITHAGARGLIVAAQMLNSRGGNMRICGARGAVEQLLASLGFNHLVKLDPTMDASIAALLPDRDPATVSALAAVAAKFPAIARAA